MMSSTESHIESSAESEVGDMELLAKIGLTIPVIVLIVIQIVLIVLLVLLFMKNKQMNRKVQELNVRCNRFMEGTSGSSIENDLYDIFKENREIAATMIHCEEQIEDLYRRLQCMIQKVGVVKYDAFSQMGGELSYAFALLDENDNGFVINSVHSAEGCYSYTKIIRRGRPDIELSSEEAEALRRALNGYK